MSTVSAVIAALHAQLKASSDLSYVPNHHIYLGVTERITNFPCLVVEYRGSEEVENQYGKLEMRSYIAVFGFIKNDVKDLGIVGDANHRGIADFETDIKKAIFADVTLGGVAYYTRVVDRTDADFSEFPVRSVGIIFEVQYDQVASTRA